MQFGCVMGEWIMTEEHGVLFLYEEARFLGEIEERLCLARKRPDNLVPLAEELVRLNLLDKAQEVCGLILVADARNSAALGIVAWICRMKGCFVQAEALLKQAH